ncbi:MAG: cyclase family protein [Allosphingosinicella sp.]
MTEQSLIRALTDALATGAVRVVDLTQSLSPETPALVLPEPFGQCVGFSQREVSRYDERGVAWYWNEFTMNEHTGTHFDAPVHWVTGKDLPNNAVDSLPVQDLVAPAVVLDFSAEAADDADFVLTRELIELWEAEHGRIEPRSWVLFRTDWSKRQGEDYTNRRGDGAHTPGPDVAAVRFLVDEREVLGFGVETIGTDWGQAHLLEPPYPAHHFLHGAGRYGLQCLANLDQLPPRGAVVITPPLKIAGGSGSPLRVLALVPGNG